MCVFSPLHISWVTERWDQGPASRVACVRFFFYMRCLCTYVWGCEACASGVTCGAAAQRKLTTFVRSLCLSCHIKTPHYLRLCHCNSHFFSINLLNMLSLPPSVTRSVRPSLSLSVISRWGGFGRKPLLPSRLKAMIETTDVSSGGGRRRKHRSLITCQLTSSVYGS